MKLKFITRMMMCAASVLAMTSCSLDDDPQYVNYPETAYGIIVNASPESGNLFFYADANQVNSNAINYGTAMGYYNFYTGDRQMSIKNEAGVTVATDSITLQPNDFFTAFAVNTYENIELVTYRDSLEYPESGHALIRFINLSPDAPEVNVTTPTQTLATGVAFKEATGFVSIAGGTYDFTFNSTESGDAIYTDSDVEITNGHIYTIYTKGFVAPAAGSNDTFSAEKMRNY